MRKINQSLMLARENRRQENVSIILLIKESVGRDDREAGEGV